MMMWVGLFAFVCLTLAVVAGLVHLSAGVVLRRLYWWEYDKQFQADFLSVPTEQKWAVIRLMDAHYGHSAGDYMMGLL